VLRFTDVFPPARGLFWVDMPSYQSCRTGDAMNYLAGTDVTINSDGIRLRQAYRNKDAFGEPIRTSSNRFAENPGTLFSFSPGYLAVLIPMPNWC